MNKKFRFTSAQRSHVLDALRSAKFADEDISCFIGSMEFEIERWRFAWPEISLDLQVETRARLKRISNQLHKLENELRLLPAAWSVPIWLNLAELEHSLPPGVQGGQSVSEAYACERQMLDAFLPSFQGVISRQIDQGADKGRRANARKAELIKTAAIAFDECFGVRPTRTPDGPFIETIAAIGTALDIPIGKDAVGTALNEIFKERPWIFTSR
jgi:hypothetical protein